GAARDERRGLEDALDADRLRLPPAALSVDAHNRAGGGDQHRGTGSRDDSRRAERCAHAGAGEPRPARARGLTAHPLLYTSVLRYFRPASANSVTTSARGP